ncbi:DNA primase [Streptomyces sp. NBC_01750]|uniref:DNA primase n=1 Tax=Streptomyces sp. NBC_01750 TaxID=2975928 RepID=UPI002DDB3D6E|nr:DNA primase [Streptomyces sp. NBC_01750]WSD37033.1 DNA primase [Streptomyces sp. NBC_01750]
MNSLNNRLVMGLAVGAGYVLGRTKKAKLAFAIGTMVAGKRLQLSPRALGDLVTQQLQSNPQFKAIGDQLREDLRGVGRAATGALVNRQLEGMADRLHERTLSVQDRIYDADSDVHGEDEADQDLEEDEEKREPQERAKAEEPAKKTAKKTAPTRRSPAKKAAGTGRRTTKQAAAKKATSRGGRSSG